ncbi:MAG: DUF2147 domain-containing protein [Flectobacillus sp.]|uniref:DUF2147 domain-containing protein n=1 Tax=Flectobacillus sp. TaxID=50419 RepID=UPI003B9AA0C8
MKMLINLFGIGLILLFSHFYKTESTSVEGMWLTADKLSKIQIYEENGKYHGKIAWLKQPTINGKPVLDTQNQDESLRNKPMLGLVLLKNFKEESKNTWRNGTIYDPRSGKTYDCVLTLKNANTLDVRGYIGKPIFGKSVTFTRE